MGIESKRDFFIWGLASYRLSAAKLGPAPTDLPWHHVNPAVEIGGMKRVSDCYVLRAERSQRRSVNGELRASKGSHAGAEWPTNSRHLEDYAEINSVEEAVAYFYLASMMAERKLWKMGVRMPRFFSMGFQDKEAEIYPDAPCHAVFWHMIVLRNDQDYDFARKLRGAKDKYVRASLFIGLSQSRSDDLTKLCAESGGERLDW